MKKHTYKVLEANKEDPTATRIEKSGIVHDFMIADMLQEQEELERYIREFTKQAETERYRAANVRQFHPFIKKLAPKQLFAAKMLFESEEVVRKADEKVAELATQLKESKAELKLICKTLDIKLPTKAEVVEQAVAKITEHGE